MMAAASWTCMGYLHDARGLQQVPRKDGAAVQHEVGLLRAELVQLLPSAQHLGGGAGADQQEGVVEGGRVWLQPLWKEMHRPHPMHICR